MFRRNAGIVDDGIENKSGIVDSSHQRVIVRYIAGNRHRATKPQSVQLLAGARHIGKIEIADADCGAPLHKSLRYRPANTARRTRYQNIALLMRGTQAKGFGGNFSQFHFQIPR